MVKQKERTKVHREDDDKPVSSELCKESGHKPNEQTRNVLDILFNLRFLCGVHGTGLQTS